MQTLVTLRNFDADFWEQNPVLAHMSPFHELKEKDKNSSKVMKAIYMIHDSKSPFKASHLNETECIKDVNKNFLENEHFPWEDYQRYVDAYKDRCRSVIQKKLDDLVYEINEMDLARKEKSFDDPEEVEHRMKMYKMVKNLYKDAIELQKELNEEVGEQSLYGDYIPSLIESYGL